MGSRNSTPGVVGEEILVHSFELDPDADTCQMPWICPRKNAMFHPPESLNENVQQFLSLAEAEKILADLNAILHRTAFSPGLCNPCFLLALLSSCGASGIFISEMVTRDFSDYGRNAGLQIQLRIFGFLVGLMLPFICFLVLLCVTRSSRRKQLTNYIADWNSRGNGVKLSFGGWWRQSMGAWKEPVIHGSESGGTYDYFNMAAWDSRSSYSKGYLHVHVQTGVRQQWCSTNGTYYVAPIPLGQTLVQVVAYQPPPGYVVVPMEELQTSGDPTEPPSYEKAVAS